MLQSCLEKGAKIPHEGKGGINLGENGEKDVKVVQDQVWEKKKRFTEDQKIEQNCVVGVEWGCETGGNPPETLRCQEIKRLSELRTGKTAENLQKGERTCRDNMYLLWPLVEGTFF